MKKTQNALSEKKKELVRMNREVRRLVEDLDNISDLHNAFKVEGGVDKVIEWFECFPIESLGESLDYDYGYEREKFSLADMHRKCALRREHERKEEELSILEHKRMIAEIDFLMEKIKRIE